MESSAPSPQEKEETNVRHEVLRLRERSKPRDIYVRGRPRFSDKHYVLHS